MKNILKYIVLILILPICSENLYSSEKERIAERIYVSTDRSSYIAGENLWLSAYCMNISRKPELSGLSSMLYIEVQNSNSVVLTAKLFLINGRGSGNILLPPALPTGNYKLVAYTKQMLNEEHPVFFEKVISVYNVLTADKVAGNVKISSSDSIRTEITSTERGMTLSSLGVQNKVEVRFGEGGKIVPLNSSFPLTIVNNSDSVVTLNISVVKSDSLPEYNRGTVKEFFNNLKNQSYSFNGRVIPEYEGEIIEGTVNVKPEISLKDKVVFLSAAGEHAEIYSSVIDSSGKFRFYTNSFFGDKEIVLEVPAADSTSNITFEIADPFVKKMVGSIPDLYLDKRYHQTLAERGIEMQIGRRFGIDTLFEKIKINNDPLLRIKPVTYKLDDYTRFPVMQEVMIEYISELRFRKLDGRQDLQMRWEDSYKTLTYSKGNTLVLLDGIPVFDHTKIFNYDPLKVKSISIYGAEFFVGYASFEGLVLFKTYKGDYSGFNFGRNVRIMDYQGALFPSRFTASAVSDIDNFPDMRSLLYWNPQIEIKEKASSEVKIHTSSLPGRYKILIEGITLKGEPVEYATEFTVR